jgi:FtsH-binding integral membrane protein
MTGNQQGPPPGWGQQPPPGWGQPPAQGGGWQQPPGAPPGWGPAQGGQWQAPGGAPPPGAWADPSRAPGPMPHPGMHAPNPLMTQVPASPPVHGQNFNAFQQRFFQRTFGWMFMGLGITAAVSAFMYASGLWIAMLPLTLPLIFVQFGLVWWLSSRAIKMSTGGAIGSFLAYSAVNGLTLGVIFAAYAMGTIATAFVAAMMMFGFMFVLGSFTKRDLSGMGTFLIMALFGLIAASFINIFASMMGWFPEFNQGLYWVTTYAGVIIFAGLTAWDAQKLKAISREGFGDEGLEQRVAVLGALTLYLDFINLFLFLLRIFGGRRD